MIAEPQCSKRSCKHFDGVKNDGDETTERVFCKAYSDKIPDRIAYGKDLHMVVADDQDNDVIYEENR